MRAYKRITRSPACLIGLLLLYHMLGAGEGAGEAGGTDSYLPIPFILIPE